MKPTDHNKSAEKHLFPKKKGKKDELVLESLSDVIELLNKDNPKLLQAKISDFKSLTTLLDGHNNNLLHICCRNDFVNVITFLVKEHSKTCKELLFQRNDRGETPFFAAVDSNRLKISKMLLGLAKDKRVALLKNTQGVSPIHNAAFFNNQEMVQLIIDAGEDINLTDELGNTPLHFAVSSRFVNRDFVKYMVGTFQADFSIKNREGKSAVYISAYNRFDSIISALLACDSNGTCMFDNYDARYASFLESKKNKITIQEIPRIFISKEGFDDVVIEIDEIEKKLNVNRNKAMEEEKKRKNEKEEQNEKEEEYETVFEINVHGFMEEKKINKSSNSIVADVIDDQNFNGLLTKADTPNSKILKKEKERSEKWIRMCGIKKDKMEKRENNRAKWKHMQSRVRKGVPASVRALAWSSVTGRRDGLNYQELCAQKPVNQGKLLAQLDADIKRSHAQHEIFTEPYGYGQYSLFRLLRAYSMFDSVLEYTQGMSDLAGFLLMYLPEEDAFYVFVQILNHPRYNLREGFLDHFPLVKKTLFYQDAFLHKHNPRIAKHFDKIHLNDYAMNYVIEWYMLFFIRVLPYDLALRIFDIFIAEGYFPLALDVAMTIFDLLEEAILKIDENVILMAELKKPGKALLSLNVTTEMFLAELKKNKTTQKEFRAFEKKMKKLENESSPK